MHLGAYSRPQQRRHTSNRWTPKPEDSVEGEVIQRQDVLELDFAETESTEKFLISMQYM